MQAFLVGFSSIHWREAWKYGERAFRYCQHDAGHAIGALRIAAATLGWSAWLLNDLADETIEDLLGLNRAEDFVLAEREYPDALLAIWPTDIASDGPAGFGVQLTLHIDSAARTPIDPTDIGMAPPTGSAATNLCAGRSSTQSPSPHANRPARRMGSTAFNSAGREPWSRKRQRPAGRADHPAAAKLAGLRQPDVDRGRTLLSRSSRG